MSATARLTYLAVLGLILLGAVAAAITAKYGIHHIGAMHYHGRPHLSAMHFHGRMHFHA